MQPTRNQVICDKFHYDCLFLKICALVHTCDTHLNIDVRSCLNFTSAFLQHSGETILFFCCFFLLFLLLCENNWLFSNVNRNRC